MKRLLPWLSWMLLLLIMSLYLTSQLRGPDQRVFLPGPTTHGHYQIEIACQACHTPMMGVREQACYDCHGEDLRQAKDTHPKSKFTDPRNADRVAHLDARNCVACHIEHRPEQTSAMGLTLPEDYCAHCHQEIARDRPSHQGMGFETCATAGCHNYHDNTALYEAFLTSHLHEPDLKDPARVPRRSTIPPINNLAHDSPRQTVTLTRGAADAPPEAGPLPETEWEAWATTAHARAGVNCTGCHQQPETASGQVRWSDTVDHTACAPCHDQEVTGFLAGKHGMRLAQNLSPMTPALARLPMQTEASHRELTCASCHGAHGFETTRAAVDSCLECHADEHSLAFRDSPHFELWRRETAGEGEPGSGVSCATCHLPRQEETRGDVHTVRVVHNQNLNMQPNEKMIRTVCLDCHGLQFALDALADPALIQNNFNGRPSRSIASLEMAEKRLLEIQQRKSNQTKSSHP